MYFVHVQNRNQTFLNVTSKQSIQFPFCFFTIQRATWTSMCTWTMAGSWGGCEFICSSLLGSPTVKSFMSCPLKTINSYFSFLGAMYFSTSLSSVPSERTVKRGEEVQIIYKLARENRWKKNNSNVEKRERETNHSLTSL